MIGISHLFRWVYSLLIVFGDVVTIIVLMIIVYLLGVSRPSDIDFVLISLYILVVTVMVGLGWKFYFLKTVL